MSNLTSTLTLQLVDDGLAKKAAADAEALKKLGASGADLKKLAGAHPEVGKLVKSLDDLAAKGTKLDGIKAGSRALKDQGAAMRQARAEAERLTRAVAAKEKTLAYFDRVRQTDPKRYAKWEADGLVKGVQAKLKGFEKASGVAAKRLEVAKAAFMDRGRAVRASRQDLLSSGVGPAGRGLGLGIAAAEKELHAQTEAANAALRQQVALIGQVSQAEAKAAVHAREKASADKAAAVASRDALRSAVEAGRAAQDRKAAAVKVEARRRATASADLTAGMGGAGRKALAEIHARDRLREGMSRAGAANVAAVREHEEARPSRRRSGRQGLSAEERQEIEAERREHYVRHHGVVGYAAAGAAGYASAHGVMGGVEHAVKAGANYQHEVVALRNAGRTPEEMAEIEAASKQTTAALPTATYEENLKVVNETTGAFGSLHHALEHLTFMQKAASVIHAAAGDKVQDDAGEMGNKMARFAEERGSAGNGEQFEREMGKLVRAISFTRGNFNPTEMLNFAQQAKASLIGYNEEFLTGVMPSIVSTMKGDRAGTAANAFNSVIDGKVNDKKQAEEWLKLGLLDKSQAIMKAGHAMGWRTGAIKDTALAHANPLQWMEEVLLPALKEKGGLDGKGIDVDDKEQLKQAFATLLRNQNANMFASEIGQLQMRQRLHKDKALMEQSGSIDENYARNLAKDPKVAATALRAGVENVSSSATGPAMEAAAGTFTLVAASLQSLANVAKDHPNLAMAGGATAAGGALAGAGLLSYKIATGFGLGTSATALSTSAAALSAAAAELTGAAAAQTGKGALGALPAAGASAARLGALGAIGLGVGAAVGVATIAAGVYAVDQTLPNNNRMNGNGRAARAPVSAYMPEQWGNGRLDVSGGRARRRRRS